MASDFNGEYCDGDVLVVDWRADRTKRAVVARAEPSVVRVRQQGIYSQRQTLRSCKISVCDASDNSNRPGTNRRVFGLVNIAVVRVVRRPLRPRQTQICHTGGRIQISFKV